MKYPPPTRGDHEKFCHTEAWTRVRDARGRTGIHQFIYELTLPDGRVLRTGISHPPDRTTYGPAMWAHILKDQLDATEAAFWDCVNDGTVPNRGPTGHRPDALPADLVYQLIVKFRVPEAAVAQLTKTEAIAKLQELWGREL